MSKLIRIYFSLFLCLLVSTVQAQQSIDRKIVIEGGKYYYFKVNNETQFATLYTGTIKQKLSLVSKYAMPIGRDFNEPLNPLCFDISKDKITAINWILNSNNSRNEAIKSFNIRDWQKASKLNQQEYAQNAFDLLSYAPNEPWDKMLSDTNVLINTFFDLIKPKQLVMAVCNQNNLRISTFDKGIWKHSPLIKVDFQNYFSLVYNGKNIGIVDAFGAIYSFDDKKNTLLKVNQASENTQQILIIDKDQNKIYTLKSEAIEASSHLSLNNVIHQSAKEINY